MMIEQCTHRPRLEDGSGLPIALARIKAPNKAEASYKTLSLWVVNFDLTLSYSFTAEETTYKTRDRARDKRGGDGLRFLKTHSTPEHLLSPEPFIRSPRDL
jgi:hypothetical protein